MARAPAACTVCLIALLAGCPTEDPDGFGSGDDDSASGLGPDPGDWIGFGDHDVSTWDMLVLYAIGGWDFDLGTRNIGWYGLHVVAWDDDDGRYRELVDPGFPFADGSGLFRGDAEYYDGDFYSVSTTLDPRDGWGGGIQVIPDDGGEPYLLGTAGSFRGLALEPDLTGGFVVCGSTEEDGDNNILWVDERGAEVVEFPLPDDGSCYDVALGAEGNYWVTDGVGLKVLSFDLVYGEFTEFADLTEVEQGETEWVTAEIPGGALLVAAEDNGYAYDIATGEWDYYMELIPTGITSHHVTNIHYSYGYEVFAHSGVMRDLTSSTYVGPHSSSVSSHGGGPDGLGFHFADYPDVHEGEIMLDFVLLGELE